MLNPPTVTTGVLNTLLVETTVKDNSVGLKQVGVEVEVGGPKESEDEPQIRTSNRID